MGEDEFRGSLVKEISVNRGWSPSFSWLITHTQSVILSTRSSAIWGLTLPCFSESCHLYFAFFPLVRSLLPKELGIFILSMSPIHVLILWEITKTQGYLVWRGRKYHKAEMTWNKGDNRGWNGWMASPTQWTWVCASSGSWWWTGKPGVLQPTGSQGVGRDWVTELNWTDRKTIEK